MSLLVLAMPKSASEELAPADDTMSGMPLVFQDDFEKGDADRWEPVDPGAWKVVEDGENKAYALLRDCKYSPKVRSPENVSMIKRLWVSDFLFEARFKSTEPEYGHRDMCIFFGHQDPTHFYYVHFSAVSDELHNIIGLVNGKDRVKINHEAPGHSLARMNDLRFHDFKVTCNAETGKIMVYLDNLTNPILTATDRTLGHGFVGLGSFDDTGSFDDIKLWGKIYKSKN